VSENITPITISSTSLGASSMCPLTMLGGASATTRHLTLAINRVSVRVEVDAPLEPDVAATKGRS
jgi:hypothetical protein